MVERRHRRRWPVRTLVAGAVAATLVVPATAPATAQEQRERLPPPADDCTDPVAGVWKSHQYDPAYGDWTVFMLHIRRVEGSTTELTGRIVNHSWDAGPQDEEPPACSPGRGQWMVSMDARGRVEAGGRLYFGGVGQWRLDRVICNLGPGGYNLDNFSGTLDPELQEFQSVNNDGGRSVNDPTVFRRISCGEAPPAPHVNPTPPAFYPELDTGGCGI